MSDVVCDATGFLCAPMEVVRDAVGQYVSGGYDLDAMRQIVAFALSVLVERTLTAQLTNSPYVRLDSCSLTLEQAWARIYGLKTLPLL